MLPNVSGSVDLTSNKQKAQEKYRGLGIEWVPALNAETEDGTV